MKKSTTFTNLVQTLLKEEDVKKILETLGYSDPARRFTAHQLLLFFTQSELRHRIVFFNDNSGNEIRVATNLMHVSAE